MSSSKEKKNSKASVHAIAAWEWFKEAAWLQVLLIIVVVVGLVISIPYAVKGISSALAKDDSKFYEEHRINYATLNNFLEGKDTSCNGIIGDGNDGYDESKEGFVVLFEKSNCDNCKSVQKPLETWYKTTNDKDYAKGNLKLYTIDISWDTEDTDKATANEGKYNDYKNEYISIEQQFDVQNAIKNVYLDQDDVHKATSVTEEVLNKDLTATDNGGTLPAPCFVTFIKDKSATNYITNIDAYNGDTEKSNVIQYTTPSKVIFGPLSGLSFTSARDVAVCMSDIYFLKEYKGNH